MATARRIDIEVAIGSLRLLVAGSVAKPSTSQHAVTAELIWPRNGMPSKRYARIVTLRKNVCEFKADDWIDAILFKDAVEGRFALRLTISQALSDSVAEKLLRVIAKAAAAEAADKAEDLVPKDIDKIFAAPIDFLASALAGEERPPVAEGLIVLDAGSLPASGTVLTLPLTSPSRLTRTRSAPTGKGRKRVEVIGKGDPNGEAALTVAVS
ncbi:MAG: hypothetical protein ACOX9C_09615 [Kiritimatiellia bacterium]|jgi:hypothetical protein